MHLYGIGELTEIHGRLTADQYIEILEEVMVPSVRAYALPYPERIISMQVCYLWYAYRYFSITVFSNYYVVGDGTHYPLTRCSATFRCSIVDVRQNGFP